MIETKTSLLKEKKQELDLLNKQYDKYIKNIISIISFNTVNNNYLYLTSYEEGGFKFTYSKDIVNFYAYYTKNNGFSIKARNSNEMLDFESFEILNNHYKDFYKLVSFFNEKKCIEVSTNITNFISEIVSLEDQIKTLSEEIEKNQEQYAFEEISFGLKLFSQQDIDEQIEELKSVTSHRNLKLVTCNYNINKKQFYFKTEMFTVYKKKRIVITDCTRSCSISIKTLGDKLSKQVKIAHLNNKKAKYIYDLDFLNFINKGMKKLINKDDLIQQLRMLNNIKNF
tara:strand:- start:21577 stop:22425 length:849 start_codon:yes stop_codon:yes gene_type:complete